MVAVALGGPEVAAAFAALSFDHLLFTGSTAVGRKIMAAAALLAGDDGEAAAARLVALSVALSLAALLASFWLSARKSRA